MKRVKLTLDILMLAATLTLFNKNLFGQAYHELAGLALVGLCAVHIAINLKTIAAMCRKFLRIPLSIKVGLVVDILLILSYSFIGLSGVMISKTILTEISSRIALFQMGHTFASACVVFLLGIHIGLHICRRPLKTALAVVLTAAVLCGGLFGVLRTDELRWLSMPFSVEQTENGPGSSGEPMGRGQGGPGKGLGHGEGGGGDQSETHGVGENSLNRPGGMGAGHGAGTASTLEKLADVAMFGCMILSCSILTYWPVVLSKKKGSRQIGVRVISERRSSEVSDQ